MAERSMIGRRRPGHSHRPPAVALAPHADVPHQRSRGIDEVLWASAMPGGAATSTPDRYGCDSRRLLAVVTAAPDTDELIWVPYRPLSHVAREPAPVAPGETIGFNIAPKP